MSCGWAAKLQCKDFSLGLLWGGAATLITLKQWVVVARGLYWASGWVGPLPCVLEEEANALYPPLPFHVLTQMASNDANSPPRARLQWVLYIPNSSFMLDAKVALCFNVVIKTSKSMCSAIISCLSSRFVSTTCCCTFSLECSTGTTNSAY